MVWPRIFFPFGPNEDKQKFFSTLIFNLKNKNKALCNFPHHNRDYIFIEDLTSALKYLIYSNFHGEIDIGSGSLVNTGEAAKKIARDLNSEEFLQLNYSNNLNDDRMNFIAKNSQLYELGWEPKHSFESGIKELVQNI